MRNLKIGFVSLADQYSFDKVLAREMYQLSKQELQRLNQVTVVAPGEQVITMEDAGKAEALFKAQQIDVLLVQNGTFSSGQVFLSLVQNFPGPVALWALPEPPFDGGPLKFNSLCGVNLNASLLSGLGRKYKYFYAGPSDPAFAAELLTWLKTYALVLRLKESRIGLFGSRTPGFYTFGLNELSLRKAIGPEVFHVDLSELFAEAEKIPEADAKEFLHEIGLVTKSSMELPASKQVKYAKTYLAFRHIIRRYGFTTVAVKCWPEFIADYGMAVCATMAKLVDDGIMAGCEGDLLGAITSLVQLELAGQVPFIADLVSVDFAANTGMMWHCGCAPFKLAHPGCPVRIGEDFGIGGLNVEFALQPGRVTLARLSFNQDKYRLLVTTGEAVDTTAVPRGTAGIVKFDAEARKLLDTLIYGGFEHHLGLVYADIKAELVELGRLLDLETVVL